MAGFYDFEPESEVEQTRDSKVDDAKEALIHFFEENPQAVFYEHQLEVIFEKTYFHWITGKALHELDAEEKIASELVELAGPVQAGRYLPDGYQLRGKRDAHCSSRSSSAAEAGRVLRC